MPIKPSNNCITPAITAKVMKVFRSLVNNDRMVNVTIGMALAPSYKAKTVIALSAVVLIGRIKKGYSIPAIENPAATNTFKTVMIFKNVDAFICLFLLVF